MTTRRAPLLGSPNYAGTRQDRIADATARLARAEEFRRTTRRELTLTTHARRLASLRNLLAEAEGEESRAASDLGSAVQEPRD